MADQEPFETIEFAVSDHVATITLNRPAAMNAFNQTMLDEFPIVWKRCRTDDDIRAVVLRANGVRAFSTGVDVIEGRDRHENPWSDDDPGVYLGAKQNRVWKPLICALHGMVAGGAFYWVNEADVVICSEEATFFDPHTTYGKTAALEPIGLLRRIPFGDVARMALFGNDERMSSTRALQIGLVTEVVTREALWDRAAELARRLTEKPPIAVQGTVRALWDAQDMSGGGGRSIPMIYTKVSNPLSEEPFSKPTEKRRYEIR